MGKRIKSGFMDKAMGFGVFAGVNGFGFLAAHVVGDILREGPQVANMISTYAFVGSVVMGYTTTRVMARARHIISTALQSATKDMNLDPVVQDLIVKGPRATMLGLAKDAIMENKSPKTEAPLPNIKTIIERDVAMNKTQAVPLGTEPEKDEDESLRPV